MLPEETPVYSPVFIHRKSCGDLIYFRYGVHSREIVTFCRPANCQASLAEAIISRFHHFNVSHPLQTPSFGPVSSSAVTCISSFDLPSSSTTSSSLCTYVLVADNAMRLHVLHGGKIVLALQTPSVIRSMAAGNFLTFEESRSSTSSFHAQMLTDSKGLPIQIGK